MDDTIEYSFMKDGKSIAILLMPADVECFSILGDLMAKLGVTYVTLDKGD
jgi:hypothetical protein